MLRIPPTGTQQSCAAFSRFAFLIFAKQSASALSANIRKTILRIAGLFSLVPVVGLEPTRRVSPQDFESSASASFTTPANRKHSVRVFLW